MSYQPVTFSTFGGLELRSDPEDVGPLKASAGLNFDLDRPERVRSRDGSTRLGASTTTGSEPQWAIPMNFAGTQYLLTMSRTTTTSYLDRFDTAGTRTQVGNWGSSGYFTDYVRFGSPTAEVVYITTSSAAGSPAGTLLRKYDGTTLSSVAGMLPVYVALLPGENRVAQGHYANATDAPGGANGSRSTVFFSDAGAAETYGANNYVHLQPGDGEQIIAMENWREMLMVFKQSTVFVFGRSSTDPSGNPVFNYRTVSLPSSIELPTATKRPVAAGTDGAYFFAGHAIYKTTGGEPVVISDAIEPILRKTASSTLNYGGSEISLSWANERLYVRYLPESGSEPQVLVYDTRINEWLVWQFGDATNTTARIYSNVAAWQGRPYYLRSNGGVMYLNPSATADDAVAIASSWQSGHYDLDSPERKRIRETILWGHGSPTLSVFVDEGTSDSSAAAVTLGTAPAIAEGRQRVARRGVFFSHKISASSGAWSVSRVTHHVADQRGAGVKPT